MPTQYFRRLRMRYQLSGVEPQPKLPKDFTLRAWDDTHLDLHAALIRESFAKQVDTQIFPNLRSEIGCQVLMRATRDSGTFCPAGCWMIQGPSGPVGCIQALFESKVGYIQNLAVLQNQRGHGLGTALICATLCGFSRLHAVAVELEVTEHNSSALSIYRRLGFREYKTEYRAVDYPDRSMVGLGI
jgi:ribosomal protein S18 acetylase RimI-like enzyme